jgi:hypothetical protein
MFLWAPLVTGACGTSGGDSPEVLARAVFEAVRAGDQNLFLSYQRKLADVQAVCPMLTAEAQMEVVAELQSAQDDAIRSLASCRQAVDFSKAKFVRADRSPSDIITFRWASCTGALTFSFMRVEFDSAGTAGSLIISTVATLGNRWVFEGGVRLCEGPQPQP